MKLRRAHLSFTITQSTSLAAIQCNNMRKDSCQTSRRQSELLKPMIRVLRSEIRNLFGQSSSLGLGVVTMFVEAVHPKTSRVTTFVAHSRQVCIYWLWEHCLFCIGCLEEGNLYTPDARPDLMTTLSLASPVDDLAI